MSKRTGIMLPTMFTEKLFNKLPKPVYVQPKIEGDRMRGVPRGGDMQLLSSGGKERISVPHIYEELKRYQVELDGELYCPGMRHSEIRSIVSRTKNLHPDYGKMEYHIFDIITSHNQKERFKLLNKIFCGTYSCFVKRVPTFGVYSLAEMQEYYSKFLSLGYEGIIIRHPLAGYVRRKCTTLLKLKPRVSEFFEIIDVLIEKDLQGVSKNTFGAFKCVTEEGEVFNVGSGPTNYQRSLIWRHRDLLIGERVKVRFQDYTRVRRVPKLLSIDKEWLAEIATPDCHWWRSE